MEYLLFFLAGVVFIQWVIPLVDEICNTIMTALEVVKSNLAVKIAKCQVEMRDMGIETDECKHEMGFHFTPAIGEEIEVPEEDEECEETDE